MGTDIPTPTMDTTVTTWARGLPVLSPDMDTMATTDTMVIMDTMGTPWPTMDTVTTSARGPPVLSPDMDTMATTDTMDMSTMATMVTTWARGLPVLSPAMDTMGCITDTTDSIMGITDTH